MINRILRILSVPFLAISFAQVTICTILSIPIWVYTGKWIIGWSCNIVTRHINYILGSAFK